MKLSTITTFLLTLGGFASSIQAQHHGSVSHPGNYGVSQHHFQAPAQVYNYDRGRNFYNNNYGPRLYGYRTGYGYNSYQGLGIVNPLYLNNLSYPIYGGSGVYVNPYPFGSQQYRWWFFRQYGFWPY